MYYHNQNQKMLNACTDIQQSIGTKSGISSCETADRKNAFGEVSQIEEEAETSKQEDHFNNSAIRQANHRSLKSSSQSK